MAINMHQENIIAAQTLTKTYGKNRGISGINLDVRKGEVFGYLGPNGAGKTTTIRLLLDFIRPSSGSASIFGLDTERSSVAIHRRLGYLPGELAVYADLTGGELLKYEANIRGGVDWSFVDTLVKRLEADLKRKLRTLSHGNRQKIGLIQAFMHQPELVILDEPTTGLDPLMQQEFYHLVEEA
ncbi:MAG TPA: ABC transporter ATP-binding protein, partial [Dehalococcoidales bacterium]|nr:ABC transporter ATP-binding protein [Dehalococcoidales bacterium]